MGRVCCWHHPEGRHLYSNGKRSLRGFEPQGHPIFDAGQTSSSSLGSTLGAASGLSDASEYQGVDHCRASTSTARAGQGAVPVAGSHPEADRAVGTRTAREAVGTAREVEVGTLETRGGRIEGSISRVTSGAGRDPAKPSHGDGAGRCAWLWCSTEAEAPTRGGQGPPAWLERLFEPSETGEPQGFGSTTGKTSEACAQCRVLV
mmetsp:Transcript_35866/g.77475  ORF Transcript_35866/g.77475 Transcript_35866/m.77475 type:complete len:204 (+) Transcript_35866:1369-1980(+)